MCHSGRRSGKTELLGKRKIILKALKGNREGNWRCFVGAPVRHQAKKIYWADLKALVPQQFLAKKPNESDLIITLLNGSEIHVVGLDRPERIEGIPWDHGLLDEYGNMRESAWEEHVRPALSDRKGSCDFIGVPEGRNHFFELTEKAKTDDTNSWAVWHWPSWEIVDDEEINSAKRDMDALVFQQEYGGEFIAFSGLAYYNFRGDIHVGDYKDLYDESKPLVLCFDFNVSPGVAAIIQEHGINTFEIGPNETISVVLDEVYIPEKSNTIRVCEKILEKFKKHKNLVICYGDSTGGAKGSAKVRGSDWELIRYKLFNAFGDRLYFKIPKQNPRERQRVNAVNSRLLSFNGNVRLLIDKQCKYTIKDFEGVRVIEGSAGEIDKTRDPKLTHLCFAGNTEVELIDGFCKIKNVPDTGLVRTWDGNFVKYKNCGRTIKKSKVIGVKINGEIIYCTIYHQWLTERGWICAIDLREGDIVLNWKSKLLTIPRRNLTEQNFIKGPMDIFTGIIKKELSDICIALFGHIIWEKYLKDMLFTILMKINRITNSAIYDWQRRGCTLNTILSKTLIEKKGLFLYWLKRKKRQKFGIKVRRGENGIDNIMKNSENLFIKKLNGFVPIAEKNIGQHMESFVVKSAKLLNDIMPELIMNNGNAFFVGSFLKPINILEQNFAQGVVAKNNHGKIEKIIQTEKLMDVYCINVPDYGCFALKDGSIVSNSDSIGYYVMKEYPLSRFISTRDLREERFKLSA